MSDRNEFRNVELPIGVDLVVAIIGAAREVDELQEEEANEDGQDPETPEFSDPAALNGSLKGLIDDLNDDEQAALIALVWLGRGDRDATGWEELLALARERNAARTAATYLTEMEMLGDLLSEGLAAFGIIPEAPRR